MPTLNCQPTRRLLLPLLAVCVLPAAGLFAGTDSAATKAADKNPTQSILDDITPLNTLDMESSYVGESSFREKRHNGAGAATADNYRNISESEESFEYGHRIQLFGRVYLKLGVDYERFDFSKTTAPLPTSLQNIAGVVALEYVVQGQPAAFIRSKPGVYYSDFDGIRKGAFDAPTAVGSIIPVTKKFYLLAGAQFSILAKYPVLPFGGVVWLISDNLHLLAIPPEPRLVYTVNKKLDLFAGGEILGESYKRDTDPNARQQDQRFSGGVIDFTEYRGGAGVTVHPIEAVDVDFSGGWDFGRDFDYYRGNSKDFEQHGAPYAKVSISAEF